MRFLAPLVSAQLPREVETKIKTMITDIEPDLGGEGGRKMLVNIKKELQEKGYSLECGSRNFDRIEKVAFLDDMKKEEPNADHDPGSTRGETDSPNSRVAYVSNTAYNKQKNVRQKEQREMINCFICGKNHHMRYCPEKKCVICGAKGHNVMECPNKFQAKRKDFSRRIYQVSDKYYNTELSVALTAKLNRKPFTMLLDSGAGPSVVDLETVRILGLESKIYRRPTKLFGVGKKPIHTVGNINLLVDVGDNQILEHTFGVLEEDKSIRLGKIWKKGDSVIQGSDIFARSYVAELDSDDDIKIERDIAQRIPVKINPELPCQKQQALLDLCEEFSDVFAINTKSPQVTLLAKYTIDTGNSQPIRNKQRRVSPTVQYHINEQVEEMLSNGICQPSDSPWSSPVILITKKDGGTRFVIDYRGLNSVTRKDAYPMPNPRDILDKLSGSRIFSTLDCCSAYWAVPVDENDIWKTAFSTSRGHFEMLRMPFGLCNSPATYQRVIDKALKNVECTDTYVDDILVHSPKFEKHLSSLRAVLTRLRNTRIQLRPEKCSLGFDEIEFIGHVLTPHGHKPLPSTVIRINSYIPPHNKKGMQRFLGLVNFYREYIPDFSRIAEPLYRLTRKDVLWEWNSSALESFEKLKRYLTDSPLLLTYPRWDEPFYVQTDASKTGVGGILSQKDPIGPLKH